MFRGFAELDAHPSRVGDKTLTWVLVDRSSPEDPALAYARTIRREALVRELGGEVSKSWVYSVQTVLTPSEYRRECSRSIARVEFGHFLIRVIPYAALS